MKHINLTSLLIIGFTSCLFCLFAKSSEAQTFEKLSAQSYLRVGEWNELQVGIRPEFDLFGIKNFRQSLSLNLGTINSSEIKTFGAYTSLDLIYGKQIFVLLSGGYRITDAFNQRLFSAATLGYQYRSFGFSLGLCNYYSQDSNIYTKLKWFSSSIQFGIQFDLVKRSDDQSKS